MAGRLWKSNKGTALLICDIQARFQPLVAEFDSVVHVAETMMKTAWAMGLPVVGTEQYPKALGRLVPELSRHLEYETASVMPSVPIECRAEPPPSDLAEMAIPTRPFGPVFEKTAFSMVSKPLMEYIDTALAAREAHFDSSDKPKFSTALLVGLETHVCIQATALDLIASGVDVHIICDGVSSQRLGDRAIALRRLEQAGAFLTTAESAMLHLLGDASHPAFRTISKTLIEHNKSVSKLL